LIKLREITNPKKPPKLGRNQLNASKPTPTQEILELAQTQLIEDT